MLTAKKPCCSVKGRNCFATSNAILPLKTSILLRLLNALCFNAGNDDLNFGNKCAKRTALLTRQLSIHQDAACVVLHIGICP
ncbi:hypothetical protein INT80_15350 [Gallibacterium anatis]|uniref:Uncharacterized protein n=1 Tax=Gallibacterium anatis TaxID=750 RepID=A0A930Y5M2_9PAST|nr:hypothetical protein [Gallibacterium anatis]